MLENVLPSQLLTIMIQKLLNLQKQSLNILLLHKIDNKNYSNNSRRPHAAFSTGWNKSARHASTRYVLKARVEFNAPLDINFVTTSVFRQSTALDLTIKLETIKTLHTENLPKKCRRLLLHEAMFLIFPHILLLTHCKYNYADHWYY